MFSKLAKSRALKYTARDFIDLHNASTERMMKLQRSILSGAILLMASSMGILYHHMDERFKQVDDRFKQAEERTDKRFASLETEMREIKGILLTMAKK